MAVRILRNRVLGIVEVNRHFHFLDLMAASLSDLLSYELPSRPLEALTSSKLAVFR